MIPAFNAADHLAPTLESVLAQGLPSDTQIVVIDDDSDDHTGEVARSFAASGVGYRCNPQRLGAPGNFNACLTHARGELVHLLHADDRLLPGYYTRMEQAISHPGIMAAVCRVQYIDHHGSPLVTTRAEQPSGPWWQARRRLAVSNRIRPSAIAVRREAYEQVGGFRHDLPHATDWEMWARLAAAGTIWFVDEVLSQHRVHPSSDTMRHVLTGANITERVTAARIVVDQLQPDGGGTRMRQSLLYSGVFAARTALRLGREANWPGARAQAGASTRCLIDGLLGTATAAPRAPTPRGRDGTLP